MNRLLYFLAGIIVLVSASPGYTQGLLGNILNAAKQAQQQRQQLGGAIPQQSQQSQPQTTASAPIKNDVPSINDADYQACMGNVGKDGKDPYAEHQECVDRYINLTSCKPHKLTPDQLAQIQVLFLPHKVFGYAAIDTRHKNIMVINNTEHIYLNGLILMFMDTRSFNRDVETDGEGDLKVPPRGGRYQTHWTTQYDPKLGPSDPSTESAGVYATRVQLKSQYSGTDSPPYSNASFYDKVEVAGAEGCVP
jgi:hypothetical protein